MENYRQFIHRHNTEEVFSFSTIFKASSINEIFQESISTKNQKRKKASADISVKIKIVFNYEKSEIRIKSIRYFIDRIPFVTYKMESSSNLLTIESIDRDHPIWKKWWESKQNKQNKGVINSRDDKQAEKRVEKGTWQTSPKRIELSRPTTL